VLDKRPDMASAWVELARIEASAGRQDAAVAALDRAEPVAGPMVTATVRRDAVFHKFGKDSPLALRARRFEGRGEARARETGAKGK
jgi:hypothetical protein